MYIFVYNILCILAVRPVRKIEFDNRKYWMHTFVQKSTMIFGQFFEVGDFWLKESSKDIDVRTRSILSPQEEQDEQ